MHVAFSTKGQIRAPAPTQRPEVSERGETVAGEQDSERRVWTCWGFWFSQRFAQKWCRRPRKGKKKLKRNAASWRADVPDGDGEPVRLPRAHRQRGRRAAAGAGRPRRQLPAPKQRLGAWSLLPVCAVSFPPNGSLLLRHVGLRQERARFFFQWLAKENYDNFESVHKQKSKTHAVV